MAASSTTRRRNWAIVDGVRPRGRAGTRSPAPWDARPRGRSPQVISRIASMSTRSASSPSASQTRVTNGCHSPGPGRGGTEETLILPAGRPPRVVVPRVEVVAGARVVGTSSRLRGASRPARCGRAGRRRRRRPRAGRPTGRAPVQPLRASVGDARHTLSASAGRAASRAGTVASAPGSRRPGRASRGGVVEGGEPGGEAGGRAGAGGSSRCAGRRRHGDRAHDHPRAGAADAAASTRSRSRPLPRCCSSVRGNGFQLST